MSSALRSELHHRVNVHRALQYAIGSLAFIAALIAYCELGSLLRGLPAPGLRSSGPWALQLAIPWIIIGAVVGRLSSPAGGHRAALIRSSLWIGAAVSGIAAFALLGETLVRAIRGAPDLFAFVCERAPASIAASSFLVAIYIGSRAWQREHESPRSAAPGEPAPPVRQPMPAAGGEWLEVMTGTGRTQIRVGEIECLQADGNYLNVIHASGRAYLLRMTMTAAESLLDGERFMRVHRSTIVNCDMISERRPGGTFVLRSGRTAVIGRAFRHRVARRLAHLASSEFQRQAARSSSSSQREDRKATSGNAYRLE